jgi:quercetin dioxygenase-like cupin family protein
MAHPEEHSPVGNTLIFSNEMVNVWEVRLEPGQTQTWHHHAYPYVVIALGSARGRVTLKAGGAPRLIGDEPGKVVFRPAGDTHMLENIGDTPMVSRLVELKTPYGTADVTTGR